MSARRGRSPLHLARAGAGACFGLALVALALCFTHPLILAAVAGAALAAGRLAGVDGELLRAARFAVPLAVLLAAVNALLVREGLTVLWSFGELPPLGYLDVTAEGLAYGLLLGARVVVVILAFALLAAVLDPDAILRGLGRVSFRSALTAVIATRMVPVLVRDARRMDLAWRTRADAGRSEGDRRAGARARAAVVRAVAAGALERSLDVAATLELRGYATRRRGPRGPGAPWSRDDLAVLAAGLGLALAAALGLAFGVAGLEPYPRLRLDLGPAEVALAATIVALALLPFAARRRLER